MGTVSTSTINPNVPLPGNPVSSSVIRNNFLAAFNDINALGASIANTSGNATAIQNIPVSSTVPLTGQILAYNGSQYYPQVPSVNAQNVVGNSGTNVLPANVFPSYPTYTDSINYFTWANISKITSSDVTTSVQQFLLYCQLVALTMKAGSGTDGLIQRASVNAYFPRGSYPVSCPVIIPEYVNMVMDGFWVRTGSSGTVTGFYTGDTTTKALANLYQPTVILVPRSHARRLNIICNSNGSDRGSGMAVGKNWTMAALGITSGGTGYSVNDVLTFSRPSVAPYVAATATVASVNGSGTITGINLTVAGAYALPPVLQAYQWTAANGFSVFDANGNISVTGGTGSGASISNTWVADWTVSGGKTYLMGYGSVISDYIIDHVNIVQSARSFDSTYGPTFNCQFYGLNGKLGEFEVQLAFYGFIFNFCSDLHITKLNPVQCEAGVYMENSSNIHCPQVIIDTPTGASSAMLIDASSLIDLRGTIFFHSLSNLGSQGPAAIAIGSILTTVSENIRLSFSMLSAGSGGDASHVSSIGAPAISLAYVSCYDIDIPASNRDAGYGSVFSVINKIATFGSGVGYGRVKGSIELTYNSITSGVIPSTCELDVWDSDVNITPGSITVTIGGTATNNDVLKLIISNPVLSYTYNYPRTITSTVTSGATTANMAAALVAAINSDSMVTSTGMTASNSGAIITIQQFGADANNTTFAGSVVGAGTETITVSNSGAMSGSISGGTLISGGVYKITGSGAPSSGSYGTGYLKAGTGSEYTDSNAGIKYINTGTAASPLWTSQKSGLVPSGTFAAKPSASNAQIYYATDLGTSGVLLISNGSLWKPATGEAVLAQNYVSNSLTGTTAEVSLANVTIPAALLSANGSLRLTSIWTVTNNADNKTINIRFGNVSGAGQGSLFLGTTVTAIASGRFQQQISNRNSVSSQVGAGSPNSGFSNSGAANVTTSYNTSTQAMYFNIDGVLASGTDTITLEGYTLEWLEP